MTGYDDHDLDDRAQGAPGLGTNLPGFPIARQTRYVAGMVRECEARQTFIPCHETMTTVDGTEDEDDPEMTGPICRGFFDAHGHVSQLVRIAERLGAIEFVPPTEASS